MEKYNQEESSKPKGLRGWLVVYILFIIYGIVLNIYYLFNYPHALTFIISTLAILLQAGSLFLILNKKKIAIAYNKIYLVLTLISIVISSVYEALTETSLLYKIGALIIPIAFIGSWISYWSKSLRVKNTFVN